tara:strand:- start:1131 stop:2021 length:891 start_codon:yes stop_codon:yes gene_type:complete
MQYLARITSQNARSSPGPASTSASNTSNTTLEQRVLSANPLLESFGNARTLRNDNSSRFGKFIKIQVSHTQQHQPTSQSNPIQSNIQSNIQSYPQFDPTGSIIGAAVSNYLLEKTRITHQVKKERNYHVFYQLLMGGSDQWMEEFELSSTMQFKYLSSSEDSHSHSSKPKPAGGKRDKAAFLDTCACLSRIGVPSEQQKTVFGLVAAVLHLGNIEFEQLVVGTTDEPATQVTQASTPSLNKACALLGLSSEDFVNAVTSRKIVIGDQTVRKSQSIDQSVDKRDALAKLAYSSLFLW